MEEDWQHPEEVYQEEKERETGNFFLLKVIDSLLKYSLLFIFRLQPLKNLPFNSQFVKNQVNLQAFKIRKRMLVKTWYQQKSNKDKALMMQQKLPFNLYLEIQWNHLKIEWKSQKH